jgi:hypothetical protein
LILVEPFVRVTLLISAGSAVMVIGVSSGVNKPLVELPVERDLEALGLELTAEAEELCLEGVSIDSLT